MLIRGGRSKEGSAYRIISFKRPGRLYIFFDFGVGVYWSGVLNKEGQKKRKKDFCYTTKEL